MALGNELQEHDTVNRHVAAGRSTNDGPESAEGCEVRGSRNGTAKDTTVQNGSIEGGLATDQISRGSPE